MRMSVCSRRLWRISSWPAACGIRCVKPSSATASPSCTSSRTPSARVTISATRELERERVPAAALNRDPAQLGELVQHRLAPEPSPARVLHAAERHLRLVADRLVVDVDDAGLEPLREREAAFGVGGEDAGAE